MKSTLLKVRTRAAKDVLDITAEVEAALGGAQEGLCALFIQHTTAALAVGEAGEGTDQDLLEVAQKMVPRIAFRHRHDPSHAPDHMASSLIGPSLTLPVLGGRLALGTWQRVLLIELNGPRERSVVVQVCF
jgi:secondary thiamine-phosphate synthase enzyme